MFTGLIETLGTVQKIQKSTFAMRIDASFAQSLRLGESIAVDGACLTVMDLQGSGFWVQASTETLDKTHFQKLRVGDQVNLERALRVGDRLDGHWVLGHVDGLGVLTHRQKVGQSFEIKVQLPPDLLPWVVPKGSIAIDGISLTINEIVEQEIALTLIPWTATHVTLVQRPLGWPVHVETDILGKYIARLLKYPLSTPNPALAQDSSLLSLLGKHGFL